MSEKESILDRVFPIPPESIYAAEQTGDAYVKHGVEPRDFNSRPMYALAVDICVENGEIQTSVDQAS